jgi:hypothetical protein
VEDYKSFNEVLNRDSRWHAMALINRETGDRRPVELADHYARVGDFTIHETVPERIRCQFNIAKNLLLYAWFVYPFFSVAEMHVLSVLELALRTRMGDEGMNELKRIKKKRGLYSYIEFAKDKGWIRNESFSAYHRAPFEIARREYVIRKTEEMRVKGLGTIELNYDEIEVPTVNQIDYVAVLLDTVNEIRNAHAHGDTFLYPASAWQSFEMVSEFINALFYKYTHAN